MDALKVMRNILWYKMYLLSYVIFSIGGGGGAANFYTECNSNGRELIFWPQVIFWLESKGLIQWYQKTTRPPRFVM
jgi:hypothetical protein